MLSFFVPFNIFLYTTKYPNKNNDIAKTSPTIPNKIYCLASCITVEILNFDSPPDL